MLEEEDMFKCDDEVSPCTVVLSEKKKKAQ